MHLRQLLAAILAANAFMAPALSYAMTLTLEATAGKDLTLNVEPSDSVDTVKVQVAQQTGLQMSRFSLLFVGAVLEPNHLLSDYGIQQGDKLTLLTSGEIPVLPPTGHGGDGGMTGSLPWRAIGGNHTANGGGGEASMDSSEAGEAGLAGQHNPVSISTDGSSCQLGNSGARIGAFPQAMLVALTALLARRKRQSS